jgi:hypothetical protein
VIPAGVREMDGYSFTRARLESIEVASDSPTFRTDGYFLFDSMHGLVRYFGKDSTVTIPRSIVALRRGCFTECFSLRTVLFEPGSGLVELGDFVFESCTNLESICLPASLENVHGSAFPFPKIKNFSVDSGNRCLRVIADFLVDVTRSRLIRYLGSGSELTLSRSVQIIGSFCFTFCSCLVSLTFESGSKLTRIGRIAFAGCSIRSIVIPASVTTICGCAFAESGIRQISIEDRSEHFCVSGQFLLDTRTSLISFFGIAATVTIPRKIRVLCDSCFLSCNTISRLNFKAGSQLRRIERLAFGGCSSLHKISIPSSTESLDHDWFLNSHFYGGVVFDTVRFESCESLSRMVHSTCADLSGDFSIEVVNWTEGSMIPGYFVDTVIAGSLVRLKHSS